MTNSILTVLNKIEADRKKSLSVAELQFEKDHREALDIQNEISYNEMMYPFG